MTSRGSHRESQSFEKWCQSQLSKLLKFQVEEDLVEYLLEIETAKDAEEYIRDLLDNEVCQHPVLVYQNNFGDCWDD